MGDADAYHDLAANPDVWDTRRGIELIFRAVVDHLEEAMDLMEPYLEDADVMVNSSLGFAARVLRDIHPIPLVTAHLAPSLLRSIERLPRTEVMWVRDGFPRWTKNLWWRLGDLLIDRVIGPELNSVRAERNLEPVNRVLDDWATYSPDMTLGLFPDWFGPPQSDWRHPVKLTGFPMYDGGRGDGLESSLDEWLAAGPRPVVVTGGSAFYQGKAFFAAAADACAALGLRAVFVTPNDDDFPGSTSDAVRRERFAPYSALLPRSWALVSHGGVGTVAQGIAAGVPQLVAHINFDQKDNASRLEDLGVGFGLPMAEFISDGVTAIEQLAAMAGKADVEAYPDLIDGDLSRHRAADQIEIAAGYRH